MYIRVRVAAGAKKESFEQTAEDSFAVAVKEPAEQNHANGRVLELVAAYFGISLKQIRIISGHHAPGKILSIPDNG
ncbi:MAG: YggU family protein [Parcubacteria group bacterium GW2011_GWA2_49_16]|nr:MAG: YggU family protein [Parcubacteria group bacterium GW2011_GWA2_49_16]